MVDQSKIHIIIINMLKNNWTPRYYNYYIIEFIGFISIYYVINLYIVSLFTVFFNLYFKYINLL